jgi:hypothetical protein
MEQYRGRDGALTCAAPPSEPDWRISRIRLSSRWFYLDEDWEKALHEQLWGRALIGLRK